MEHSEMCFKKPVLVGKIGKLPKRIQKTPAAPESSDAEVPQLSCEVPEENEEDLEEKPEETYKVPYTEPVWSGLPEEIYAFDVLKNGSIIETIRLVNKAFWALGRLANCDISMQHPTISRYHAVLQYRSQASEKDSAGFYIYDLGSTHGTFLNKNKLKSRVYVRMQVGHMLKLGNSTRTYILNGPPEDTEDESEFTVTELKQQRLEELRKREELILERKRRQEEERRIEEARGIDWGIGEDAEEETDLSENPYAATNNEELYLDNPKKTLRGFFEREGLDLEYDCNEQGIGQFLCKVELPIDDDMGRPIFAEVFHKGKKKEAVVQCALEACRILDRRGVLRQATHESHKRKPKDWQENDYYDSDDDTFLDRTGAIEKKREMRMKAKNPQQAETYESLLEKEKKTCDEIRKIERDLSEAQRRLNMPETHSASETDSLDSFMQELKQPKADKQTINRLKTELSKKKQEHTNIIRLVNITKPASLPPLVANYSTAGTSGTSKNKVLPMFGKRKKIRLSQPVREAASSSTAMDDDEEEEGEEDDSLHHKSDDSSTSAAREENRLQEDPETATNEAEESETPTDSTKGYEKMTLEKFEEILEKQKLPPLGAKYQEKLSKILNTVKKLACEGDRMQVDWRILDAKKRKVIKLISDMKNSEPDEKLEFKVSSELNRILSDLTVMTEHKFKVITKVRKVGNELKSIANEVTSEMKEKYLSSGLEDTNKSGEECGEAKRVTYNDNVDRSDYSMWVPPQNQSGDGRTSLNDKFGY